MDVESGALVAVGSFVVVLLMAYFGRVPRSAQDAAPESLGARWFGGRKTAGK